MMTPAECRAKAALASEMALLSLDPATLSQWTETAGVWLILAARGDAQAALREKLFGQDPD
jgi:hypothetical protein